ncbi:bifunctional acetate--CoA ligase family protein/GNAT family N-acetyltransferase [Telluria mixta]|uniref:Bifunctional acetate--CoA ligase family protein/GNAT family N-acetyltransferase n=1 Tax=Telluria mixta TaxID=34071 RepID=A0ABT2BUY0_9BURK|nr:bifunctional acetate--CoA ligase family protein/GNAT family N-acetyltransferase [Telluria mixta]MCS0628234.1 bifunctional acetate--CoA ligase family protein/GNAT family N-acetyltransferase [Telluria mixta]WEM93652.1 bifunctional acetate--CoA ligase family protein/GNAT family N-acetyltransferase [Telluria mixta]
MSMRNLNHFFTPDSVAVIGASARPGSVGATVLANVAGGGFSGPIWPVNPKYGELAGLSAFGDAADLPRAPGLAVICTPAATVPGIVATLGELGCKAAVVLSAGLDAQAAGGRTLRQAMLDAARPHLLRILGPNCVGLLVPGRGLNASFAPVAALPGRLAFVAQSGALVTAVLDWARTRRIGFSCFVSLGDGSDVDFGDLLDYLAGDPGTDAILLYAESVRQARKFMSAARGAARAKPTVIVKAGRVAEAAHAAFSHTGALAGSDLVYDAALRRAGMLRVYSTDELFDAVAILAQPRRPAGPRLAILTNGGGPGVMATDALVAGGGTLAQLAPATLAHLSGHLPATWSHGNPVDVIGDAPVERYVMALRALLDEPGADAVLLIHAPTAIVPSADIARALLPLLRAAVRPVLCCWLGGASVAQARSLCLDAGVPVFDTPEEAVRGFLQLVDYARNQNMLMQVPPAGALAQPDRTAARTRVAGLLEAGTTAVGEADAKAILAAYGIPVVQTETARDLDGVLAAARRIGYPVALKILSPDIVHKTDVGGVVLDLADDAALAQAQDAMLARVRAALPQARLAGFTVQAMARRPRAHELIVGIATDPVFGPVVLFGQGGVAVEVTADQAVGLPPLNRVLAADLVSHTRAARLLAGFRDHPRADFEALSDVLVRVGQMAADLPELVELDINPLLADASGVVALDARMRLAPAPAGQDPLARLAILPYPDDLERRVDSALGPLLVRPIRPEDAPAHEAFFAALSPQDIHFRMFGTMRALSPAQLARFTQIDYAREMAFIATRTARDGRAETLGVVRVAIDPDGIVGEFAIIVRSDLHGRGLGHLLMDRLLDYCRARGLERVSGVALADNVGMHRLARSCGFQLRTAVDGNVEMVLALHG